MPRPTIDINCIDLSDPAKKRELIGKVGILSGLYTVEISPTRNTRSQQQNRYYFGEVVHRFSEFLKAQDYEDNDKDYCHSILKEKFLSAPLIDRATGVLVASGVRTSRKLTTLEFFEFVEKCRIWLNDQFGITTNDPERQCWRQTEPPENLHKKHDGW